MKSSSSDLHQLIHSLHPNEVKEVRHHLKKDNETTNSSKLFDYLLKHKEYDAEALLDHFSGTFNKKNLPPTKNALKTEVLDVLRSRKLRYEQNAQMKFRQQCDFVDILCARGFYDAGYSIIKNLKKQAQSEGNFFNLYSAIAGEAYIAPMFFKNKLEQEMHRISEELLEVKKGFNDLIDIHSFYTVTSIYELTNSLFRDYNEYAKFKKLSKHPSFKLDPLELDFQKMMLLCGGRYSYYKCTNQHDKAFMVFDLFFKKVVELEAYFMKGKKDAYFNILSIHLKACISANKFVEAEQTLKIYDKYIDDPKFYDLNYKCDCYQFPLLILLRQNQISKDNQKFIDALDFYKQHKNELNIGRQIRLAYTLMIVYFDMGEPGNAVDYCNDVIDTIRTNESNSDLQEYAEVLKLLIEIERKDTSADYIQDCSKQYYKRRISKNKKQYPFEMALTRFINQYTKLKPSDSTAELWENLYKEMLQIKEDEKVVYFKRFLDFYDIIDWVKKKKAK